MNRSKTPSEKSLRTWLISGAILLPLLIIMACSGTSTPNPESEATSSIKSVVSTETTQSDKRAMVGRLDADSLVAAQETVMTRIYQKALPSVVNIQVAPGLERITGQVNFPTCPDCPKILADVAKGPASYGTTKAG